MTADAPGDDVFSVPAASRFTKVKKVILGPVSFRILLPVKEL